MDAFLTHHDSSSLVEVVIQQCKLKKYYGTMGISNATLILPGWADIYDFGNVLVRVYSQVQIVTSTGNVLVEDYC